MEDNKELWNRIRELNMVEFLSKLGFEGKKVGRNYSYSSPLRAGDSEPSFKVHAKDNVWIDFGDGSKGNIFDFGIAKFGSVGEFLNVLRVHYPNVFLDLPQNSETTVKEVKKAKEDREEKEEPGIKILNVRSLFSYPLLKYLEERRIHRVIADQFCKEVSYQLKGKTYYAIGFKNDSGGFALRNRHMKQASSPNDLTFIDNGAKECASFEGSFDFLSYKTLYHNQSEPKRNYLILNSTSFIEKALSILQKHDKCYGFWDNDKAGDKCTRMAKELLGERFSDERGLYKQYNDLNDFHKSFGLNQKPRLNQKF